MSFDLEQGLENFYAALRNLNDFEKANFRNVIKGVLLPTLRDKQITVNYHRAAFNVEMMLEIKDTRHFQTVGMLARSIFELGAEAKCIYLDKDASRKIELFVEVEKLKAARRISAFRKTHPKAQFHFQTYEDFIESHGKEIDEQKRAMWPPAQGKDSRKVDHWTGKSVEARAMSLGAPFDQIYQVHYAQLSWMTHSGVSQLSINDKWVTSFVALCYTIAVWSYQEILEVLVNEFRMYEHDPSLKGRVDASWKVAFAKTEQEAMALLRSYGI